MSTIHYVVARNNDEVYKTYLETSIKKFGGCLIEIYSKENERQDIQYKYMKAVDHIKKTESIKDDDIILFVHEDTVILDQQFKEKVELIFKNPNVGLVGVVGTTSFVEAGGWWMATPDRLRGHLIQGKGKNLTTEGMYLKKGSVGYFNDVCAIDGCIMITTGKIVKNIINIDINNFTNSHFYDIDFCFQILNAGLDIVVADILVYHKSEGLGSLTNDWKESRDKLIHKYKNQGLVFPINKNSFNKQNDIIEIEI